MAPRNPGLSRNARNMRGTAGGYSCACGARSAAIDGRPTKNGFRRRRECPACGARFTTYEIIVNGDTQLADRADLIAKAAAAIVAATDGLADALQHFKALATHHQEIAASRYGNAANPNGKAG